MLEVLRKEPWFLKWVVAAFKQELIDQDVIKVSIAEYILHKDIKLLSILKHSYDV